MLVEQEFYSQFPGMKVTMREQKGAFSEQLAPTCSARSRYPSHRRRLRHRCVASVHSFGRVAVYAACTAALPGVPIVRARQV